MVLREDQNPMSATNEKLRAHITATANRLRMIQVDFADESDQTRQEYLCEEIEHALKSVMPDERRDFLEGLKTRFPTLADLGGVPVSQSQEDKTLNRPTPGQGMSDDHGMLVELLVKMFPTLSDDGKGSVVKGLQQGGIAIRGSQNYSGAVPTELPEQLQTILQPDDDSALEPARVGELAMLLADFVIKIEPLVWNTWRNLSPRSNIRPSGNIKDIMKKFACSGGDSTEEPVVDKLKELHQIIAAMITSVGRAGDQFAKHHLSKLSPAEISALVRLEPKSVLVGHEVKCWRKYQELAGELTEASIEAQIREAIVDFVESLMEISRRH